MTTLTEEQKLEKAYEVWNEPWFAPVKAKELEKCNGDDDEALTKFAASWGPLQVAKCNVLKKKFETPAATAGAPAGNAHASVPQTSELTSPQKRAVIDVQQQQSDTSAMALDEPHENGADEQPTKIVDAHKVLMDAAQKAPANGDAAAASKSKTTSSGGSKKKKPAAVAAPVAELKIEPTNDCLRLLAEIDARSPKITADSLAAYCAKAKNAHVVLAALVGRDLTNSKSPKKDLLANMAVTSISTNGYTADNLLPESATVDLGVLAVRKEKVAKMINENVMKATGGQDIKVFCGKNKAQRDAINASACLKARAELCCAISFNSIMPYSFADSIDLQFFVMPYMVDDDQRVIFIPNDCVTSFFPLKAARAFIHAGFAVEFDWANGKGPSKPPHDGDEEQPIALFDVASLGQHIKADVGFDTTTLTAAYLEGDSSAVFKWFCTNLPKACDSAQPEYLTSNDFKLTQIKETYAALNAEPQKKKRKVAAKSAKGGAAAGADGGDGGAGGEVQTLKKFTDKSQPPKPKARSANKIATGLVFGVLDEGPEDQRAILREVVEKTGVDVLLKETTPMTTIEEIRSIVSPSTEGKPVGVAKKAKANGNAAAGVDDDGDGDENEVCEVQPAARAQYLSLCYAIPKIDRHLWLGTQLAVAEKNGVADGVDPASKAKLQTYIADKFARAHCLGRVIPPDAVFNQETMSNVLDGVLAKCPKATVDLIAAEHNLNAVALHTAIQANKRGKLDINPDKPAEFFRSRRFLDYLYRFLYAHEMIETLERAVAKGDDLTDVAQETRNNLRMMQDVSTF